MMLIAFESSCMGAPSETGVRGPMERRFPPGLESVGIVATPGSCQGLMQVLTPKELSTLAGFASFRLARVALNPADGEDLLQDALLAVLRGLESSSEGRHPRKVDLASISTFMNYLRGIIASLVEAERRRFEHDCVREEFDGNLPASEPLALHAGLWLESDLEFRDLRNELFGRLTERAPEGLLELVQAWQERWDDGDGIPLLGRHRRHRGALRKLAAEVWTELLQTSPYGQTEKALE
jgi:hypothetical protein